jgi:phage-related protein
VGLLVWNGQLSTDYRIQVEKYPNQPGPSRRYDVIQVPGRNGDLLIDQGAYDNVLQNYEIFFGFRGGNTPVLARAIRDWLLRPIGYQRLEDSYDPDFYRLAYYSGPVEIENIMNMFGRCTLAFSCKPQRWAKSGEFPALYTSSVVLYNDLFPALPLIKVNGTGAGTLFVGDYSVAFSSIDSYTMLDSELQDAYKGTQNKNNTIQTNAFPVLEPGDNPISWSGEISSIEITPRWWTI